MQSQHEETEDFFFDSLDSLSTSFNYASSEEALSENLESEFENFDFQVWVSELRSICERRAGFLHRMGFDELVPSQSQEIEEGSLGRSPQQLEMDGLTETSGAVLDSLGCSSDIEKGDQHCCIRDLDKGKKFTVHEFGEEGLTSMALREVDSGRLITWEEFELSLGFSHSVQTLMLKNNAPCREKRDGVIYTTKRKSKSWWKGLSARRHFGDLCNCSVPIQDAQVYKAGRTKLHHHGKRCKEFTAASMGQELQAHKGPIWTMKFSPDGRYLATGGEDCVVRIWRVMEVDTSSKFPFGVCLPKFVEKEEESKLIFKSKHPDSTPIVIPRKTFKLLVVPTHEFLGHTSDILDLSWSESNCLLTSSKDKTVRMWKVGHDHCLKVFRHNNYVTGVQFNPVDSSQFISGSIDGKVRIWGISENHVIDWVDIRDIVTAVSYRPDGQGFVVGSISGNCRFYCISGNSLQLDAEFSIQGRKKTTGKRVTGFQFSPQDPEKVMITSADSRVQIVNGVNVIHKYGGLRKAKNQLSASFTSDGRYIVSVSEDSRVYVWNYVSDSPSSKGTRSVRSCACFSSKDVSIAIPWPGTDRLEPDSRSRSSHLQPQKMFAPSTCIEGAECFSLGAWFFSDCQSRASATWPEEKLGLSAGDATVGYCPLNGYDDHQHYLNSLPPATWSRVIVTAGHDGTIKSFHNYGLPVRL
uniref:Putative WD repeat-containing protein C3H5.08c n=1 Tax=Anthurium amnicola TaxID=1678845 RepID=A0A1D1ZEI3_9ARAE